MNWNSILREAERRGIMAEFEQMEQEAIDGLDFAAYQEAEEFRKGELAALVKRYGPETATLDYHKEKRRYSVKERVIRSIGAILAKCRDLVSRRR